MVRLRVYHPADKSPEWGVLGWKGPVQRRGEYRLREEWESRVDDPKAVLVILRHRQNLARLSTGTERRFSLRGGGPS